MKNKHIHYANDGNENHKNKRNRKYTPIVLFNFYIISTLFISIAGPWEYIGYNTVYSFLYMVIFLLASTMTYLYFVNRNKGFTLFVTKPKRTIGKFTGLWVAKTSIFFAMVLFIVMITNRILLIGLPEYGNIFRLMAQAYTNKLLTGSTFNLSAWLFNYFSIFYIGAIALGLYYFKGLSKSYRIMLFFVLLLSIAYHFIFVGNQKALGDIIIIFGSVFFARFAQSGKRIEIKTIMIVVIAGLFSFFMFSYIIQSRMNLWNVEYYSIGNKAFLDINHWMLSLFSNDIKLGAGTFMYYLSSGYYGLSLALQLPFVWTFGFGSSFELRSFFGRFLPLTDDFILTYPVRIEAQTGWDAYANWHTVFPWLASDLTFWGAILFLSVFIAIYATSWNRILRNGHWINILMFANINIMLLYIPANNQLFQTRASLLVTIFVFLIWLFKFNSVGDEI